MDDESKRESWSALVLSRQPGVGAAALRALVERHGSPSQALAAWRPAEGQRRPKAATAEGLERARRWIEEGGEVLRVAGPGYPPALLALGEPPPALFVRGAAGALGGPLVALVGGRRADARALGAAEGLGRACARAGAAVVSGGARGVDAAALRGALDEGGQAVAVLGSGVDVDYPPEHAELFARCEGQGAVVSELLPGTPPSKSFFVTRNRIVAALAGATVLVWGNPESGALTTVRWARRLGRPAAALRWQEASAAEEAERLGAAAVAGAEQAIAWIERLGLAGGSLRPRAPASGRRAPRSCG